MFTGCIVTATILTSVVLDRFGLVGFKDRAASVWCLLGCAQMIGGLALIATL